MNNVENKTSKTGYDSGYEHAILKVYCPSMLIEDSEELRSIFRCRTTPYCIKILQRLDWAEDQYSVLIQTNENMPEKQPHEQLGQDQETLKAKDDEQEAFCLDSDSDTATKPSVSDDRLGNQPTQMVVPKQNIDLIPTGDDNVAVQPVPLSSTSVSTQTEDSYISVTDEEKQSADGTSPKFVLESKKQHALYHHLHGQQKCPYFNDLDMCKLHYDESAAEVFIHYLRGSKISDKHCEEYIVDHLSRSNKECDSSCPLWEVCLTNKIYKALKYASEGFVIFSKLKNDMVGKICEKSIYRKEDLLGKGAFGEVYKLSDTLAVKEEIKRPVIFLGSGMFQRITNLNNTINDHVIPLLEYTVGRCNDKDPNKRVFLFVMPLMNKGGLNKHFEKYKCVLEYMARFPDQMECIFSNYIVLFLHVFQGLEYLHSKNIVHGDVKDTNILVHQTCSCVSPLLCACPGGSGVTYALGDMDLFCVQGETLNSKYLKWAKEKFTEPAGTRGLKATELYFMGLQGEKCASNKTDIWASSLTMIKILAGDDAIESAIKYLNKFFDSISLYSSEHVFKIAEARSIAEKLQKDVLLLDWSQEIPGDIEYSTNTAIKDIRDKFKKMSQLLASGKFLKQGRWIFSYTYPERLPLPLIIGTVHGLLASGKFLKQGRWIFSYTYPERLPLPLIIGTVHGANVLYEECLSKIPDVFGTPLWETMKKVLKIITTCVRFLPEDRPDASKVITDLKNSCTTT